MGHVGLEESGVFIAIQGEYFGSQGGRVGGRVGGRGGVAVGCHVRNKEVLE